MTVMRTTGLAPVRPCEASVDKSPDEYVVRVPVRGYAQEELKVEIAGRLVKVLGDQVETAIDQGPFCLHERLEETFRLPADADAESVTVSYMRGRLELRARRTNGASKTPLEVPIRHHVGVNAEASGV